MEIGKVGLDIYESKHTRCSYPDYKARGEMYDVSLYS